MPLFIYPEHSRRITGAKEERMGIIFLLTSLYWAKTYGGGNDDYALFIQRTFDNEYTIAGATLSYGAGGYDGIITKIDSEGNINWAKTFGGTATDYADKILQTAEGDFVVVGYTTSYGAGSVDGLITKLDSVGSIIWAKTYGGGSNDYTRSIQQTTDKGFIVAGYTLGYGAGLWDFLVLKVDSTGSVEWSKTYGGTNWEKATSVAQTLDGGYVVGGFTQSYGAGGMDLLVVKLDSSGTIEWTKTFGGSSDDYVNVIRQTPDSGCIIVGKFVTGSKSSECFVTRLNSLGDTIWTRIFGGDSADVSNFIQLTSDSGYIVVGSTKSYGAGSSDGLIVKMDSAGNIDWARTFGGVGTDYAMSVQQIADSEYIIAGYTDSYGIGGGDFYILKTNSSGIVLDDTGGICEGFECTPTVTPSSITITSPAITTTSPSIAGVSCSPIENAPSLTITTICEGPAGVEENTELQLQNTKVTIYPNPISGNTVIKYNLPEKANVQLNLYDITGRLIKIFYSGIAEKGYHTVIIRENEFTKGIYLIKFQSGNFQTTRKLTILR